MAEREHQDKEDWLTKCLNCNHSYYRKDDADTLYCRCRNGKCNFSNRKHRVRKISSGNYEYRGYLIRNMGYYEPDHRVCWEATNLKTGCGDYHGYTKREIIEAIDEEADE